MAVVCVSIDKLISRLVCHRLLDDVVIIVLKRKKSAQHQYYKQMRRSSVIDDSSATSNQDFYLELNISSTNNSKRQFNQLKWKHYAVNPVLPGFVFASDNKISFFSQIIQGKNQVKTNFELTSAKYPPLMFSRVKSYHSASESPLQ